MKNPTIAPIGDWLTALLLLPLIVIALWRERDTDEDANQQN